MIKLFIADDHSLIRAGLTKILKSESDLLVLGDTANPFDVLPFLKKNTVDVLILDINMPGKDGLDLLKDIKALQIDVKVLILSMYPEDRYAIRSIKAGASGYVTKETATEELIKAIRKVAGGGRYISSTLAERLAFELDSSTRVQEKELSDREFQILVHIAQGKSQSDIAIELALSPSTINTYRSRILEKLNLKTTAELIHYAIQHRIID